MIGALLLGLIAGVIGRILMPRDAFRHMRGPKSWLVSLGLGIAGALVGYAIFTVGLGVGDTDVFDWGGVVGAIIGVMIVIPIANWIIRRSQRSGPAAT
jgi:uncharacterized membrane protein YeaQ/YmgE (transglycosylase-associated protein family)